MIEGNSPIMTLEETAKYLKIRKSTLYKMVREGKIPAVKIEFGKDTKVIIRVPSENLIVDPYFHLIPLQKELSIMKYSRRTIKSYLRYNRDLLLFTGEEARRNSE